MAKKELKAGQAVSWDSSGGHSTGKVVKKVTSATKVKTHKVAASKENPEYLVRSDKSGKMAAHKPEELKSAGAKKSSKPASKKAATKKPAAKKSPAKTSSRSKKSK